MVEDVFDASGYCGRGYVGGASMGYPDSFSHPPTAPACFETGYYSEEYQSYYNPVPHDWSRYPVIEQPIQAYPAPINQTPRRPFTGLNLFRDEAFVRGQNWNIHPRPQDASLFSHPLPMEESIEALSYTGEDNHQNGDMLSPLLPCQNNPPWDYNMQCYDIRNDGSLQGCRYVNVVDLEDFMNNEKRKEKSRDAARCRRSRETEIFSELGSSLPLSPEDVDQLDKASVMRLAISYLKVRGVMELFSEMSLKIKPTPEKVAEDLPISLELSYLKALDGFVLVISSDGDIVYLSENVSEYLGVSQMDVMGQSIYEFSHPCDHEEIRDVISAKNHNKQSSQKAKSFFIRLKCTLTSKGRNVNIKSASYKVIHCIGHLITNDKQYLADKTVVKQECGSKSAIVDCIKAVNHEKKESDSNDSKDSKPSKKICSLVAIGRPIPHPSNIEVPLDSKTFLSKHSLDMKFTYADEKMLDILGYEPDDLNGKSVYEYHHSVDSRVLLLDFKCLFSKGQCETGRYRFLAKSGGYAWVLTQATLMLDKQLKPVSVVCVNYVISGVECKDEILSCSQLEAVAQQKQKQQAQQPKAEEKKPEEEQPKRISPLPPLPPQSLQPQKQQIFKPVVPPIVVHQSGPLANFVRTSPSLFSTQTRPKTATAKVFAPRSKEEMNRGFLTFSDEEPGLTMLKEEPEDLTHLAPTAGDVCIPLEDNPFDVFEEFMLNDSYLMPDGFDGLGPAGPGSFAFYRDDIDSSPLSDISRSPLTLSPSISKNSDGSIPSLSSPNSSLPEEELSATPVLTDLLDVDMASRAPYIPMGPGEDLPLLGQADARVMWGALPDHITLHKRPKVSPTPTTTPTVMESSNLARLLGSPNAKLDTDHIDTLHSSVDSAELKINSSQNDKSTWLVDDPNGDRGNKRAASPPITGGTKRARARKPTNSTPPPPPPASSVLMNLLNKTEEDLNSQMLVLDENELKIGNKPNLQLPDQFSLSGMTIETKKSTYLNKSDDICRSDLDKVNVSNSQKFISLFSDVMQNGSDPILTTVIDENSNKSPSSVILDPESSLFEDVSSNSWNIEEDTLLLEEFNTPI